MDSEADSLPPMAVRWEYATHRLASADLGPRVLNHYGVQGWELISCVVLPKDDQPLCCVFKRRVNLMADTPTELRVCIDVDDLARAVAFYTDAMGLRVGRRIGSSVVELLGAPCPIDLLRKPAGSAAHGGGGGGDARSYRRHWTPVHLDFVFDDVEAAVARAVAAGATVEQPVAVVAFGKIAQLADPFGHGLCFLQMVGRGYDVLAEAP